MTNLFKKYWPLLCLLAWAGFLYLRPKTEHRCPIVPARDCFDVTNKPSITNILSTVERETGKQSTIVALCFINQKEGK